MAIEACLSPRADSRRILAKLASRQARTCVLRIPSSLSTSSSPTSNLINGNNGTQIHLNGPSNSLMNVLTSFTVNSSAKMRAKWRKKRVRRLKRKRRKTRARRYVSRHHSLPLDPSLTIIQQISAHHPRHSSCRLDKHTHSLVTRPPPALKEGNGNLTVHTFKEEHGQRGNGRKYQLRAHSRSRRTLMKKNTGPLTPACCISNGRQAFESFA